MATKRGYYKEELARAKSNLEMALTHLYRVVEAYAEAHPDIAANVGQCGDMIVLVAETIEKINERI